MTGDTGELERLRKEVTELREEAARRAQEDQRRADAERRRADELAAAERLQQEAAAAEEARRRQAAEADALLIGNLHAQAVAVTNIRALVPVVLEFGSTSYPKWRGLHLITLGKYALTDHVLSDAIYPDVAPWHRMDCVVISWIFGTISANLLESVMTPYDTDRQATSREVWLALEDKFIGNKETRAMILDTEFRTFIQGDLNISDYCRKLKTMADQLGSLGEPVLDRTLVLATLRGLNERFTHMAALLKRQKPFPSFDDVRNDLLLEEITLNDKASTPSTALLSTGNTGARPPFGGVPGSNTPGATTGAYGTQGGRGPPPGNNGGSTTVGGNRPNNRRRRNNNGGSNGKSGAPQGGWPPSFFNPWSGTVQVWPHHGTSRPSGGQAPRPSFQQQAPHAFIANAGNVCLPPGYDVPPQVPYVPGVPLQGAGAMPGLSGYVPGLPGVQQPTAPAMGGFDGHSGWDSTALANAFSTMQLTPPPSTNWYMDSGASDHMTSDAGSSHQESDRQVQ